MTDSIVNITSHASEATAPRPLRRRCTQDIGSSQNSSASNPITSCSTVGQRISNSTDDVCSSRSRQQAAQSTMMDDFFLRQREMHKEWREKQNDSIEYLHSYKNSTLAAKQSFSPNKRQSKFSAPGHSEMDVFFQKQKASKEKWQRQQKESIAHLHSYRDDGTASCCCSSPGDDDAQNNVRPAPRVVTPSSGGVQENEADNSDTVSIIAFDELPKMALEDRFKILSVNCSSADCCSCGQQHHNKNRYGSSKRNDDYAHAKKQCDSKPTPFYSIPGITGQAQCLDDLPPNSDASKSIAGSTSCAASEATRRVSRRLSEHSASSYPMAPHATVGRLCTFNNAKDLSSSRSKQQTEEQLLPRNKSFNDLLDMTADSIVNITSHASSEVSAAAPRPTPRRRCSSRSTTQDNIGSSSLGNSSSVLHPPSLTCSSHSPTTASSSSSSFPSQQDQAQLTQEESARAEEALMQTPTTTTTTTTGLQQHAAAAALFNKSRGQPPPSSSMAPKITCSIPGNVGMTAQHQHGRRRWYFGIQSKKDPAHVMMDVYRALMALGCEWMQLSSLYQIKCRWKRPNSSILPPRGVYDMSLFGMPGEEASSSSSSFRKQLELDKAMVSNAKTKVVIPGRDGHYVREVPNYLLSTPDYCITIGLTLYKVEHQSIYLLDFQKMTGDAFSFMTLCAHIMNEIKSF